MVLCVKREIKYAGKIVVSSPVSAISAQKSGGNVKNTVGLLNICFLIISIAWTCLFTVNYCLFLPSLYRQHCVELAYGRFVWQDKLRGEVRQFEIFVNGFPVPERKSGIY